jgi:hypothetical protein
MKSSQSKSRMDRAADKFIEQRLALGRVAFPLADLVKATGLSVTAARNQLLRLKKRVTRVSPRHQFFLIVSPEHSAVGAPPVAWWLHDYFQWLGEPYYLALQSAASSLGSNPQALQVGLGLGGEQRGGFSALASVQAFLFAGFIVMDVINPAIAAVKTESLLHIFYKAA